MITTLIVVTLAILACCIFVWSQGLKLRYVPNEAIAEVPIEKAHLQSQNVVPRKRAKRGRWWWMSPVGKRRMARLYSQASPYVPCNLSESRQLR